MIRVTPNSKGTTDLFIYSRCKSRFALYNSANYSNLTRILRELTLAFKHHPEFDGREPVHSVKYSNSKEYNARLRKFRKATNVSYDFSPKTVLKGSGLDTFYDDSDALAYTLVGVFDITIALTSICCLIWLFP